MSEVLVKVRGFIFENFMFDGEESALKNDGSFLDQGIIDSTGVLELVDWIEDEFGFQVDDVELVPENLDSVNQLSAFIKKKLS